MPRTTEHQASFRLRRREAGHVKCSFYLDPQSAALLAQLKEHHGGTVKATVEAALAKLAAEPA